MNETVVTDVYCITEYFNFGVSGNDAHFGGSGSFCLGFVKYWLIYENFICVIDVLIFILDLFYSVLRRSFS